MKRVRLTPWLAAVALLGLSLSPSQAAQGDDSQAILRWVQKTYGIQIVTEGVEFPLRRDSYTITGDQPSAGQLAAYLPLLQGELARYPPDLPRPMRLRTIILARKLAVDGQPRAAVPDFATMNLLLDVDLGSAFPRYQQRVIHHELFHLIDFQLFGPSLRDPEWVGLNGPRFHYGRGGRYLQDSGLNPEAPTRSIPGVLSLYATSAPEEDRAEFFSFLLTDVLFVNERAGSDPVVAAKVLRVKDQLRRFCPDLNDRYWRRLEQRDGAEFSLALVHGLLASAGCRWTPPCLFLPVPAFTYTAP